MAPRKGASGGKKKGGGGKKGSSASKKRAKQWDDYVPRDKKAGKSTITDEDEGFGKSANKSAGKRQQNDKRGKQTSMMGQWKDKKINQRKKERQFMSKTDQKKAAQREQLLEQRKRLANAAYTGKEVSGKRKAEEMEDEEDRDEDDDSDSEEDSDEEERGKGKKRKSVFDQFVQAFQPSRIDLDDEDEEEEEEDDEAEYEEIEVDEDGNPIEPEEDEEEEEEDAEDQTDDADEETEELEDAEEEEQGNGGEDDEEEEAESSALDPYRQRFLLGELTEAEAKKMDAAPRKFVSLSTDNADDHKLVPSSVLEEFNVSFRRGTQPEQTEKQTLQAVSDTKLNVRSRLLQAWKTKDADPENWRQSSPLEYTLFKQFSAYTDVFFAGQTYDLTRPLRRLSAMHALNHVLKSRDNVVRNNERLKKREQKETEAEADENAEKPDLSTDDEKEYRDQGFCRASVLILMPLRSAASQFVTELLELLPSTVNAFHNKDRFFSEYGSSGQDEDEDDVDEDGEKKAYSKDDDLKDWQRVFAEGNNDDSFQIGISISRKSVKFYSDYRQADIIIASPLGLRQQLGDEVVDIAETQTISTDFLSSIEVCVLDSASLLLMQNVEHLRHVLQALNVKPKEAPNADFSRLRDWNLSFLGAYFRQTIVFAHGVEPILQNLVNKCCKNQSGVVKYVRDYDSNVGESAASITRVVPQIKQIFQRMDLSSGKSLSLTPAEEVELRFEYFQKHIFTPLLDNPRRHVLIFVPSYFDYVRIRNLFHETMNEKLIRAVQCCEYTTPKQISRARTTFFHGRCHVMLFTERFHFYHQYQMRGIHQIIFYGLPVMGDFYPEMLNMFEDPKNTQEGGVSDEGKSTVALFTRLDLLRLQRIVGQKRAERMCQNNSKKATFLFC